MGFIYCENILGTKVNDIAEESHLLKAVVNIISEFYTVKGSYFHVINSVSNVNQDEFDDIITEVLKNSNFTVQIEDVKENFRKQKNKRFSVLIFTDSVDSFMKFYSKFSSQDFKLRRFFTVIFIEEIKNSETKLMFQYFWKLFIKNVNVIMRHKNGTIDLFTFLPFNESNKCGDTTPVKINSFDKHLMKWDSNAFHPIKSRDMHKCPLIIGCAVGTCEPSLMTRNDSNGNVEVYGIEKDIFMEFSRQLNFEAKFEIHGRSPGLLFENGSASGKVCSWFT